MVRARWSRLQPACCMAGQSRSFPPSIALEYVMPCNVHQERRLGLPDDDECQFAGGWLRFDGLPAGLAGWMLVHGGFGKWTYGKDPEQRPTSDEVLDNFSLHWLTNTVSSGARLYWENRDQNLISAAAQKTDEITIRWRSRRSRMTISSERRRRGGNQYEPGRLSIGILGRQRLRRLAIAPVEDFLDCGNPGPIGFCAAGELPKLRGAIGTVLPCRRLSLTGLLGVPALRISPCGSLVGSVHTGCSGRLKSG